MIELKKNYFALLVGNDFLAELANLKFWCFEHVPFPFISFDPNTGDVSRHEKYSLSGLRSETSTQKSNPHYTRHSY